MVETRLQLVAVQLEQEKQTFVQLISLAGTTLLLITFGLMSLLVLIFLMVDPAYRIQVVAITTAVLLILALLGTCWTLKIAYSKTLLAATREQLKQDVKQLKQNEDETK
ncbi:Inner membrane protein YqjE [Arsenophonus endosymbiont of Aleurodicus floccissimus]|uniref:phage holin family protein n=1 Tax=Arsenophonus endosymbiont of Aleurodicus floccissimus TaxID=2152761 RepID=UPI000EEB71CF|nr:Inner membrane protein YqjE [Arsenophonus endosymbiont of Aleurodicus floccissimus]